MDRINVTKTFLPPLEEYQRYVEGIWSRDQLTNQGPLLLEFEQAMRQRLGVENFHFVANGTLALQITLRALDVTKGEVITTPFSYVASTSAILWEHCDPVFVDIEPDTFCIDPGKIEAAITQRTRAILPVHVFGRPCDVEAIDVVAKKHGLKVIYDGAHAFGTEVNGKSLLNSGDVTICSFHATKLFHTVEGGAVIARDKAVSDKVELMKRFGHNFDDHFMLGMNAKASEFHAAMGLCNLKYIDDIIAKRERVSGWYDELLNDSYRRPLPNGNTQYNYSYYPVVLESEERLLEVMKSLEKDNIYPRRYFYPSLNTLPYLRNKQSCPVSEDISKRILCLPLYGDLDRAVVEKVTAAVNLNRA